MTHRPILVVEDDGLIRMDLMDMLSDAGYEVLEAGDADRALVVLQGDPAIRALLTDIDMPGSMNGVQLAHCTKERWPNCKIIVISGRYSPSQGSLPDDALFLSKPVSEGALIRALAAVGVSA